VRLYSWNVNGVRAAARKGLLDWLAATGPDVLCLQETKADPSQLADDLLRPSPYESYWAACTTKKGYSGVATYARVPVREWRAGFGVERFDAEGRVVVIDLGDFDLYNVYFPNSGMGPERLAYKLDFYAAFLEHVEARRLAGRPAVFCGDVNTAHRPIDLARPKENAKTPGFLPVERAVLDDWAARGWVDTFRHLNPDTVAYTWWDQRFQSRARNVGWRIDYFFVHASMLDRVRGVGIEADVQGSDHCPIWLDLAD
jgi:exodeoxyribonuclease III